MEQKTETKTDANIDVLKMGKAKEGLNLRKKVSFGGNLGNIFSVVWTKLRKFDTKTRCLLREFLLTERLLSQNFLKTTKTRAKLTTIDFCKGWIFGLWRLFISATI